MATLTERMKVALWFLQRPRFYPEFIRYTTRRLRALGLDRAAEARAATQQCEALHVDPAAAIREITGRQPASFEVEFRDELARANAALERAPVRMHGAGNLDLIYQLSEHVQATRAIETGVSAGWSSLAFLLSLHKRGGRLISTDMPYPGSSKEAQRWVGCVVPDELRPLWTRIDAADSEALPRALAELPQIDICHYDSDKSYDGRMWAYRLLWPALRQGGILISDDIDDNFGFFHFCGEVHGKPTIVRVPATKGAKYIGILVKSAAS